MLKIGIFGVGRVGRIHLDRLKAVDQYQLVGFYDINDENSAYTTKSYGIKRYHNYLELIDDSDVISIITPSASHYDYARAAITRGRHVFIEKPLVNDILKAEKLIKLAEEAGVKVQVGHVERFNPGFLAAKQYLDKPMFIEARRLVTNQGNQNTSIIYDLMLHDIDIIISVVNSPVKRIHASGAAVFHDAPTIANARIEFGNGAVAILTSSSVASSNYCKTTFYQRQKIINVDFLNQQSDIISQSNDSDNKTQIQSIQRKQTEKNADLIQSYEPGIMHQEAIEAELRYLYESIINNTSPAATINDGYQGLQLAKSITEKIQATF